MICLEFRRTYALNIGEMSGHITYCLRNNTVRVTITDNHGKAETHDLQEFNPESFYNECERKFIGPGKDIMLRQGAKSKITGFYEEFLDAYRASSSTPA